MTSQKHEHVSAQNDNAPILGDSASMLIECNQRLQELGIQDTIKLPQIIVIGDQSAGKSSLIEALSSIAVPKASGLCTKCPISINLHQNTSTAGEWNCTISLEERYSYNAKRKAVTPGRPLGPWEQRPAPQFSQVYSFRDKKKLEANIAQAQNLILHPNRKSNDPVIPDESGIAVPFSPNLVRVDVSAANFYNLSLIDMPGTTAAADEDQEEYVVDLVKNLTSDYAQNKNNVILLTLHLNTDIATSTALGLMQRQKLQSRIIKVFTKVDIAQPMDRDRCLDLYFHNQAFTVAHGQHMVMLNPKINEEHFFREAPWRDFTDNVRANLGVTKLRNRMREILFVQTRATLPANLTSIHTRLEELNKLLTKYPEPLEPVGLLMKLQILFSKFEESAKHIFEEKSYYRLQLQQAMDDLADIFDNMIPSSNFMTEREVKNLKADWKALKLVPKLEDDITKSTLGFTYASADFETYDINLTEVKSVNDKHRHAGAPDSINPSAIDDMYRTSVQDWNTILANFIGIASSLVKDHVKEVVHHVFRAEKRLPVYAQVVNLANSYVEEVLLDLDTFTKRKLMAETSTPYTLKKSSKSDYLPKAEKLAYDTRRSALYVIGNPADFAKDVPKNFRAPSKEGIVPSDDQHNYTMMYAKVQALYRLASENLVDSICKDILAILISKLQKDMALSIKRALNLDSHNPSTTLEVAASLMCEDPAREAQRKHYEHEKKRLEEGYAYVQKVISNLPAARQGSASSIVTQDLMLPSSRATDDKESPKRDRHEMQDTTPSPTDNKKQRIEGGRNNDVVQSIERGQSIPYRSPSVQPHSTKN